MLRRAAIILILLVVSASALLAARHFGVALPWDIAATTPGAPSKDREEAPPEPQERTAAPTPEQTIEETTAALGAADEPPPGPGDVTIDISRISPEGASVFAGRATPDSYVTVLEDGKPAGTAKTDGNGEWSLSTEYRFASADPRLSYRVTPTPPQPEPPPAQVAAADPAPAPEPATPAPPSAASVAGEVMRKFESLVDEAREEAKKSEAAGDDGNAAAGGEGPAAPDSSVAAAPDVEPDSIRPEPEAQAAAPGGAGETAEEPAADSRTAEPAREPEPRAEARVAAAPPASEDAAATSGQTEVIPVPIMFVYNEASLTPEGKRAAALLLEYLTLKKLSAVELTGHADERGSDAYNYDLSRERLDAVAQLLKDGGFAGELKLTPKGKSEPYKGVDRSRYRGEALHQLDRRVELRLNR